LPTNTIYSFFAFFSCLAASSTVVVASSVAVVSVFDLLAAGFLASLVVAGALGSDFVFAAFAALTALTAFTAAAAAAALATAGFCLDLKPPPMVTVSSPKSS